MKAADVRRRFLQYFASRGHEIVPSSSLVPQNDPTLFFTNAGMVQFKDVFTGKDKRPYKRATTVQKCLRVSGKHNDLENVGRTPRHHTFFEMLGNFSFGDYFKAEAIPMAWELLTGDLGIDPDRLWVTVFEDDDEAADLWLSNGFPKARLQRLGAKDNFWAMGDTGPCGPCSEIHYDHGPAISSDDRGPAFGSDRYVEIWNLVFMQFEQSADGSRVRLPNPSIDTGAGLERVTAVVQGHYSNYDTDLFAPLLAKGAAISSAAYGAGGESDTALRVLADHARATAFLVSDGVMPSNEGRGYVLRRVMRRAIRFGVKLGIDRPFLHELTTEVGEQMREAYPDLAAREGFVAEVVRSEEERFRKTLDRGMKLLDAELAKAGKGGTVPGDVAFTLSDTYGFPLDLTELIAGEQGVSVDKAGYDASLEAQKARGRAAWKGSGEKAVADLWFRLAEEQGRTAFTGYDEDQSAAQVRAIIKVTKTDEGADYEAVERLDAGQAAIVVLDRTPFYAEAGGQVGDSGVIASESATFEVRDTTGAEKLHLHHGAVSTGSLAVGDAVRATVDAVRRDHTRRNHTGTHLLHAALRTVLGGHVTQKGSLVAPFRLRFDFSHHKPMTDDEIRRVETLVNEEILKNDPVDTSIEDLESARGRGAMALFGEKYDDRVRVVSVPGFSVELCGGTHTHRTGDIGLFHITSESGVAAGVRRLEAQTGAGAHGWVREQVERLQGAASKLKTSPEQVVDAIDRLQEEKKRLEKDLDAARKELAKKAAGDLVGQATDHGGVKVLAAEFDGDLKEQADRLRDQLGSAVVVLASRKGDKVLLVAAATKDLVKRVHAGKIIQEIAPLVGGSGGGRPDLAQGGGVDATGIPAALDRARAVAGAQIEASA